MRELYISKRITPRDQHIQQYLNEISTYPLITVEQEVQLSAIIKDPNTDSLAKDAAINKLVKGNLRFVVSVAKQYQNQWMPLADLIEEGNFGLAKAAKKFDATRGFKFISYAVRWIRQSITSGIAEYSRIVRLPANQHVWIQQLKSTTAQLEQILQRSPTQEELACELQDKNVRKLTALSNINTVYLDGPSSFEDDSPLSENFKHPEQEIEVEQHITTDHQQHIIHELFSLLSDSSMEDILKMYYGLSPYEHGYTLSEIAEKYDMTKEGVKQKIDKSKKMMKNSRLWNALKDKYL